ncbi:hypothetical protein ACTI_03110 [Actinoplanes sp. OR16]|nr:hypothetical protein ACTI_03110 [Actinoplanes sp. OR16]
MVGADSNPTARTSAGGLLDSEAEEKALGHAGAPAGVRRGNVAAGVVRHGTTVVRVVRAAIPVQEKALDVGNRAAVWGPAPTSAGAGPA